jgi:hypothetical protein
LQACASAISDRHGWQRQPLEQVQHLNAAFLEKMEQIRVSSLGEILDLVA